MCGIVGIWQQHVDKNLVVRMSARLAHRGPDDSGLWCDEAAGIALAHARLSIIDLSPAGHQPMQSASGRYVMTFNGEIYNHLELRRDLESAGVAVPWRGHSDTEILLEYFSAYGVEETLRKAEGMFALALWDRRQRLLYLARDRMGEKPLYYGFVSGGLAFASEPKAFREIPGFSGSVDRGALALFMRHSVVPAPHCIYEGVFKLGAGTALAISEADLHARHLPRPKPYWELLKVARDGVANPACFASDDEALAALQSVLKEAIANQMVADVPLGAFLSGGIDSSMIVALMQAQSGRPIKTFTIGFHEEGYDEATQARMVARHLGTEHTELYVTPAHAQSTIPRLPHIYCEPFSDSSQIPTILVSELARQRVTVSLSGDGGDELFGGYSRYSLANRLWDGVSLVPRFARRIAAAGLHFLPVNFWNTLSPIIRPFLPADSRAILVGDKIHKGADLLLAESDAQLYLEGFATHWRPSRLVLGGEEPPNALLSDVGSLPSLSDKMMAYDGLSYLPDDILVKVDRAAMSVGLETRVPFLSHKVVEFAWHLPRSLKIRDGQTKWILRHLLYKHVPAGLVERPKKGFGVPIDAWLRGPLRDWAESLLDERRLGREGFFDPAPIRRKWQEHLAGGRNWQYHLWDALMFQAWLEANR